MKQFLRIFGVLLLLALGGCNDEVFVDRPSEAPETDIIFSGTPSSKSVPYTSKDLAGIDITLSAICPIYVIDSDYNITSQTEGASVSIEAGVPCTVDVYGRSLALTFDFMRPDYLVVSSTDHHSKEPFLATVTFRYGNRDRTVRIEIAPGQLFTIAAVFFDSSEQPQVSVGTEKQAPFTVDNKGDESVKVPIRPFGDKQSLVSISFADGTDNMLDFDTAPDFDVLSADADGSLCYTNRYAKFRPGPQLIQPFRGDVQRTFVVPAHSSVRFDVTLTVVSLDYKMKFQGLLPSGEFFEESADVHVVDPVDYVIEYEVIQ